MIFTELELAEIAAADAEIEREERKKHHRRDLEKYRKYQQSWRAAHPNYSHEYYIAHRGEHRERDKERGRSYYAAHREKCKAANKAWLAKNPNYKQEYYASRAEEIKAKRRDKYAAMKKLEEVSA